MALQKLTGATNAELQEMRAEFDGSDEEFEEKYCLAKIPRQPPDYSGLPRYCKSQNTIATGEQYLCPNHGGKTPDEVVNDNTNLEPLASMKHGLYATREHLVKDFSQKDRSLYEWVVSTYDDAYNIDAESDPQAAYDLHRLATEIVRAERGRGHLISEGEVNEDPIRDDEGRIVIDEQGEIETEKSQHYLAEMMYRQDNKITKLEKELGISRKERRKHEQGDDAIKALKDFSELGSAFLQRDETDYDPQKAPWAGEDEDEPDDKT